MFNKPLQEIDASDLTQLVDDSVAEGLHIEFKEQLPGYTNADKLEYRKDVVAFANGSGGDIVFGVKEDDGVATELVGVSSADLDADISRLEQLLESSFDPPVFGCVVKPVRIQANCDLIVLRVPMGINGPHAVLNGHRTEFFRRLSNRKHPMNVPELREAFVQATTLPEKVRSFRDRRAEKILSGDFFVPSSSEQYFCLHIVPINTLLTGAQFNLEEIRRLKQFWYPMGQPFTGTRINLDGYLTFRMFEGVPGQVTYLQVYRNGVIEVVDTEVVDPFPLPLKDALFIPSGLLVGHAIKCVDNVRTAYQELGVSPPFSVLATLLGVKDLCIPRDQGSGMARLLAFDRDVVRLPEVQIEDYDTHVAKALRPLFDLLWNAAGAIECPYYDDSGNLDSSKVSLAP